MANPCGTDSSRERSPTCGMGTRQTSKSRRILAKVEYLYQHPEESSRDEIFLKSGKIFERYSAPVRKQEGACDDI
ncbi:hypothetical protein [uncultured Nostoc sp.]|uniref:hypothetical protein n=1 Tax=uncultured Nostoc sp. TaxID=340711 RepID=UPI0035CBB455